MGRTRQATRTGQPKAQPTPGRSDRAAAARRAARRAQLEWWGAIGAALALLALLALALAAVTDGGSGAVPRGHL